MACLIAFTFCKPAFVQCAHAAATSNKSPYYKKKYENAATDEEHMIPPVATQHNLRHIYATNFNRNLPNTIKISVEYLYFLYAKICKDESEDGVFIFELIAK